MSPMQCPTLEELPPPPPGKTGWPWTEESQRVPTKMPNGCRWPTVSVVTPSFNQGQFLEETVRSVLLQGYPNLEYFVLDGKSTDNSVEIIEKYSPWLSFWVSERDHGQSAAINRGLKMGSGIFATWINSDDLLCKNALVDHASSIGFASNTVYVGNCLYIDEDSRMVSTHQGRIYSLEDLLRLTTIWRSGGHIVQPETLFPLPLALEVGGLNESLHDCMDYEFWGKLLLAGARFQYTDIPFGMLRRHAAQKIADGMRTTRALLDIASGLARQAECLSQDTRRQILEDLEAYWHVYQKDHWQHSGRLARSGLPPFIVRLLRNLRA